MDPLLFSPTPTIKSYLLILIDNRHIQTVNNVNFLDVKRIIQFIDKNLDKLSIMSIRGGKYDYEESI
jgi:hypothetical protein